MLSKAIVSFGRNSKAFITTKATNRNTFARKFYSRSNNSSFLFASPKYFNGSNFLKFSSVAFAGTFALLGIYAANNKDEAEAKDSALNPKEFRKFTLQESFPINHNTKIFRFNLPTKDTELGLPIASCILIQVPGVLEKGEPAVRPYTPISISEQKGYFDLMVKVYPNGIGSKHIHNLKVGDKLEVKGPFGTMPYKANMKKNIGMIAGGTGITPMLQVCREILKNSNDKTNITLVFANISEEDILLKSTFDELASKHKNFKVFYVLEKPPKNWKGGVGYVTSDIIKNQLPPPSKDNLILVCGPPPMVEKLAGNKNPDYSQGELKGALKDLGYSSDQVHKF